MFFVCGVLCVRTESCVGNDSNGKEKLSTCLTYYMLFKLLIQCKDFRNKDAWILKGLPLHIDLIGGVNFYAELICFDTNCCSRYRRCGT